MLWLNQLLIKPLMKITDFAFKKEKEMFLQYILADANKKYQDKQ